ncbi:MAG: outer membrane protein transport protein [Anaerolineales bacterium]|jgi:long-chain fatty acid transport protein
MILIKAFRFFQTAREETGNMYSRLRRIILGIIIITALPNTVLATNGSLLIASGSKHRALGGAGVALPLDGTSQFINPASITELGIRADLGLMFFQPRRQACTRAVPECEQSGSEQFLIPNMGGAYRFNRKLSLGFGGAGVGGGSTRYDRDIFESGGPPSTVGASLNQANIVITGAYKLNKAVSVGVSPVIGVQQFRAYGLASFITPGITVDPDNVTNRGNDYSYGAGVRFGTLAQFFDGRLNLGASYTSRIYMTKLDKYRGLLTEDGEFDMPEQYTLGIAVKPIDKLTVAFDVTRIFFSDIPALGNSINNTVGTSTDPTTEGRLGEKNGGGFGWDDQWVYKLGISYDWNSKLTLRAGANYGKAPVPEDDNLLPATLAPIATEWHAALGCSYELSPNSELSFSYVHAFRNTLSNFDTGEFPISPGGGAEVQMVQNSVDVSYALKF